MRNIKKETYWKMMNSFWYRSKRNNPYSLFKKKILNAEDELLNSMTIDDWNEYSLSNESDILNEVTKDLEVFHKNKGNMTEQQRMDKIAFMTFKESQEIFYNRSLLNSGSLISAALRYLNKVTYKEGLKLKKFIFLIEIKMVNANHSKDLVRNEIDVNFSPISFKPEEEWMVDILSEVNLFGFKLIIKQGTKLILPFWDWTMTLIFDSLNLFMAKNNIPEHSDFIERIQLDLIEKWEPDLYKANKLVKIDGEEGEIDFAFTKNNVLYLFENKNIFDMHNPIDKNFEIYKRWKEEGIDKGVTQLTRANTIAKKIFPDWKFSKVIPILCTTSINRIENSNTFGIDVDDSFVFVDLDSLLFLLNMAKGYEAILFMSYFAKKQNRTGLFDMLDVVGILTDVDINEPDIKKLGIVLDANYLVEHFEGIANCDFPLKVHDFLVGDWRGNYRPFTMKIIKEYCESPILLGHGFMRAFNNLGVSKRIKVLKYIFGKDAYYDKNNAVIKIVGLENDN